MNMKKLGIGVGIIIVGIVLVVWYLQEDVSAPSTPHMESVSDGAMEKSHESNPEQKEKTYAYSGELEDVTEGVVRGIHTDGQASGMAKANFENGVYELMATFSNLPDPVGDDFYEGWIVQKLPFKFISTGAVEKIEGVYTNIFALDQDMTSYSRYVLTLEPNDGDPAPADHIVEGDMKK